MASTLSVKPAQNSDIDQIISFIIPTFCALPPEIAIGNVDTPTGRSLASARHLAAWRAHAETSSIPCAIKCVHTSPDTGKEELVGFAEWFVYDDLSKGDEQYTQRGLIGGDWLPSAEQREAAQESFKPLLETRRKWLHGRKCAVLMYLAVSPAWRRKGAGTMLVQWGVERCREVGAVAYLEATEEGARLYSRLGFETMEVVGDEADGEHGSFPVMIWWPYGVEKVPAVA